MCSIMLTCRQRDGAAGVQASHSGAAGSWLLAHALCSRNLHGHSCTCSRHAHRDSQSLSGAAASLGVLVHASLFASPCPCFPCAQGIPTYKYGQWLQLQIRDVHVRDSTGAASTALCTVLYRLATRTLLVSHVSLCVPVQHTALLPVLPPFCRVPCPLFFQPPGCPRPHTPSVSRITDCLFPALVLL